MTIHPRFRFFAALAAGVVLSVGFARAQDVNAANEKAMRAAAAKVAPSVVRIDTSGGTETVGGGKGPGILRGIGGTTGVVVSADGFIITSSFNFANNPSEVFVGVPGRKDRFKAKVVATDHTRMLTLLKIDAKDLPVPAVCPKKEMVVGQWALALGRTLDPDLEHTPSLSAGIVSATGRIWGKAIQTDAKVSPTNYGGPLIAIDGRVLGILVPMSPRGTDDTAGFDWYDSGIGFAIPLEDVLAKLPAMKEGKDLLAGRHGIVPKNPTDQYQVRLEVGAVQPDSPAAKAGVQPGDQILAIDGKPIPNYSTFRHVMEPKYEGDSVTIKVLRAEKEIEFKDVKLLSTTTARATAFLGVLPLRDDPGPGVPIRYVYPDSPAAKAGLQEGDRIMKVGAVTQPARPLRPVANRDALAEMLAPLEVGAEVKIEVKRKGAEKVETVSAVLVAAPNTVPEKLPMPSSAGKALEGQPKKVPFPEESPECGEEQQDDPFKDPPKKGAQKVETGYLEKTNTAGDRAYWLYVPDNYDANVSHGLLVWFHPQGQGGKDGERMTRVFRTFCEQYHFIVMAPRSAGPEGWVPSELQGVVQDVKAVLGQYTTDKARVVAHGMGNGGQMAVYVGFNARDLFRGVAIMGSTLGTPPGENLATQPLAFFIAGGDKDPELQEIERGKKVLEDKKFPVVYRVVKDTGKDYLDAKTFGELQVWMDTLDRL